MCICCRNGHLECLKCLREEAKAPWDSDTASWAAENGHLHILEYLVERKYDQYSKVRVSMRPVRPLGLFEVLARNRQSAVGRLEPFDTRTRKTTPSVYNTSSTTTVHYQKTGHMKVEYYTLPIPTTTIMMLPTKMTIHTRTRGNERRAKKKLVILLEFKRDTHLK